MPRINLEDGPKTSARKAKPGVPPLAWIAVAALAIGAGVFVYLKNSTPKLTPAQLEAQQRVTELDISRSAR